jgi:hypothetical protein
VPYKFCCEEVSDERALCFVGNDLIHASILKLQNIMTDYHTEAENKLLFLARSRWMRRVLEEQFMPALGKKVPLFATAQFNRPMSARVQALDPASLELTWHEVSCMDSARALRFVRRLPDWDTSDAAVLADEMHSGASEELRVAHHVMHSLDVPATTLEVAHRLAHLAPDAAALLGRALSIESQLRQVGNTLSVVAERASGLLSHVGLAVGLTCLVLNSMALNQAIRRHDAVSQATFASSVVLDAASCSFFTMALVALACKAAKVASIFSTAALPVSVAALIVPPVVKRVWRKRAASEVACGQLGALLEAVQNPLLKDETLGAHHFSRLVPITEIDFRSESYTMGGVCIEKNTTMFLHAAKNSDRFLDILDALMVDKVHNLDGTELMMILPVCSDLSLSCSAHLTVKKFSKSTCPDIEEVSKLKQKGFSFNNGLYAIHDIKPAIEDGSINVLLDDKERTFSIALDEWFPVDADGRQYDMSYTFVGCGGKAVIQLEKRQSGFNIVRLENDSENSSSTWIIQSYCKLRLCYCTKSTFIFSADGINVVLTNAEKNILYFVVGGIIFAFDHKSRKSTAVIMLGNWVQENKNDILASLKEFENAVEIQDCSCVDDEGKEIPASLVYYNPNSGFINADTPHGYHYTCRGAVTDEGSLIFHLDLIDLSLGPISNYNMLHKLTNGRLSVIVSHLGLKGYFDSALSLLLLKSEDMMLYAYSNSTAALVGVGQKFLAAAKNTTNDLEEIVSTKLDINSAPALSLFPEKRRIIAEHLQVLDSHNLWFLPFEKKLASSKKLSENVQIAGSVQGSAVFFEPAQGALFASPLLPLSIDFESDEIDNHEISQFPKYGKFSNVKASGKNQIFATTSDGLVFCVKSPKHMCLKEKIWRADDSHSSLCAALKKVDENILLCL